MALERLDYGRGRHIHLGTQAVAEGAQAVLEGDLQAVLAGLRPEPDARQGELAPGKQFPRIDLARRRHIRMAKHARRRDRMTIDDLPREMNHRLDLRVEKRAIAELVTGIDNLDPDRAAVDVARTGPIRDARVPSAALLRNMGEDRAVFIDGVMRADARRRIAETCDRACSRLHTRVVHEQDVDG